MNKITKTKHIYKAINALTIISFFITFVLLFLDFKTFDADEIESGVSPLIIFVSFFFNILFLILGEIYRNKVRNMICLVENSDIFSSKCQTLVNTVNCVGVMGKGLALEMKKKYPLMYEAYRKHCINKVFNIKTLYLYRQEDDHWILCFPTKIHWKNPSKIEWIEYLLKHFVETYKQRGITSIAFPMLGCSNGKLKKEEVLPLMQKYLSQCDILIEIYI